MIAITFALPAESAAFLRLVQDKTRQTRNDVMIIFGKIDNHAIELLHTGVGEKVCRDRVARFLQSRQFDCLISAGFAGALTDQLRVGDLMLAKNFSTAELGRVGPALAHWPFHVADLYTAPAMIMSSAQRTEITQTTGTTAVDMETKFIARACAEHALPLLCLRVISDTPGETLPAPPEVLFNVARQRTDLTKLAAFFLTHPNRVSRLIQFARGIAKARKTLANALVAIIKAQALKF